ncbi:hypothetical protein PHLCEN_2v2809 [Hermanssonia centrifuga]|uniref:Uncharacterized protein n=1 Tax=Hermanssonia centrifuga TaxID=98765 RepID=A0A2R6RI34_9APHY|nr:hypothetical protein PHLCEN_2v2809 [Hermanssonia centrifuga]
MHYYDTVQQSTGKPGAGNNIELDTRENRRVGLKEGQSLSGWERNRHSKAGNEINRLFSGELTAEAQKKARGQFLPAPRGSPPWE